MWHPRGTGESPWMAIQAQFARCEIWAHRELPCRGPSRDTLGGHGNGFQCYPTWWRSAMSALPKNDHMCTWGAHNENARSQGLFGLDTCMEILTQRRRAGTSKPTHEDYSCTAG
eukprot:4884143-Karenia_brevis.AAC.1